MYCIKHVNILMYNPTAKNYHLLAMSIDHIDQQWITSYAYFHKHKGTILKSETNRARKTYLAQVRILRADGGWPSPSMSSWRYTLQKPKVAIRVSTVPWEVHSTASRQQRNVLSQRMTLQDACPSRGRHFLSLSPQLSPASRWAHPVPGLWIYI